MKKSFISLKNTFSQSSIKWFGRAVLQFNMVIRKDVVEKLRHQSAFYKIFFLHCIYVWLNKSRRMEPCCVTLYHKVSYETIIIQNLWWSIQLLFSCKRFIEHHAVPLTATRGRSPFVLAYIWLGLLTQWAGKHAQPLWAVTYDDLPWCKRPLHPPLSWDWQYEPSRTTGLLVIDGALKPNNFSSLTRGWNCGLQVFVKAVQVRMVLAL